MANMAEYCKAYYVKDFRRYPGWKERIEELRPEKEWRDGKEHEIIRTELVDDDVLYLQPGLQVTDGIFEDENVVFCDETDAWKSFCVDVLKFEVPEYARSGAARDDGSNGLHQGAAL